jgi:UDP-N-acetylmuramyl pentapeptide phosphotransferase/UDP-N-acetylglucosamine-1-phosphate transferase/glycosyltransferase involved in cell wall biosynthesis
VSAVIALIGALIVSLGAPIVFKPLLKRWGVIDVPNERSSHSRAVIRGVGLAPLLAIGAGYAVLLLSAHDLTEAEVLLIILGVSFAAGLLGWIEDVRGIPVRARATMQLAIGMSGAGFIITSAGTSWWLLPVFGIGIAGYINVANFMDGIDGISGLHGVVVGAFYALLGVSVGVQWLTIAGLILAAAFAGFLPWNLLRGGMFLGDVGSYLLGGGIAIIAISAIAAGMPPVAVVGPLAIYLADAGYTLATRVLRGERWFEAHRGHVYQRLTNFGLSHVKVSLVVGVATALTSTLGLLALLQPPGVALLAIGGILAVAILYLAIPRFITVAESRRRVSIVPSTSPLSAASGGGGRPAQTLAPRKHFNIPSGGGADGVRVLLVAHQYWPTPGSATQVLSALVRSLREEGASVDVFTSATPVAGQRILEGPLGERVHLVTDAERTGKSLLRVLDLAKFALAVRRHGGTIAADIVISDPPPTAAWAAWAVAKRQRAKFVYYLSDSWGAVTADSTDLLSRLAKRPIKVLEDGLLRRSGLVVAVTNKMRSIAQNANAPSIVLVPNGVDTAVFTADGETWHPNSPPSRPFFLYAGNAGVVHGAQVFAAGAESLWNEGHEFDLVYMGYGVGTSIDEYRVRWPDRLHILPRQAPEVVASAYRGAIGALSSLRPLPSYRDARPIKSLAGLACGCPAVYAGDGDFAELLGVHGLGYVNAWSAEGARDSLKASLEEFHRDPQASYELRRHVRRFAESQFDERSGAQEVARRALLRDETEIDTARAQ